MGCVAVLVPCGLSRSLVALASDYRLRVVASVTVAAQPDVAFGNCYEKRSCSRCKGLENLRSSCRVKRGCVRNRSRRARWITVASQPDVAFGNCYAKQALQSLTR